MLCRIFQRASLEIVAKRSLVTLSPESALLLRLPSICGAIRQPSVRFFSVSQSPLLQSQSATSHGSSSGSSSSSSEGLSVDDKGRLIVYRGPLKKQIHAVKFFSLSTSLMGLIGQPIIYTHIADSSWGATIALFTVIGFYTYVTPLAIHALAKKYVIELLYNPESDKYTAVTYNFINRRKELEFDLDQVIVPDVPGPFSTILVSQVVNGKEKKIPLFLPPDSREFEDPRHFGRIMGFDKPLDLHLKPDDPQKLEPKK